jgi:hypothetical protein
MAYNPGNKFGISSAMSKDSNDEKYGFLGPFPLTFGVMLIIAVFSFLSLILFVLFTFMMGVESNWEFEGSIILGIIFVPVYFYCLYDLRKGGKVGYYLA